MKAVRFDQYGGVDVLKVVDAPVPEPGGSGANGRIWPAMMSAELPEGWA